MEGVARSANRENNRYVQLCLVAAAIEAGRAHPSRLVVGRAQAGGLLGGTSLMTPGPLFRAGRANPVYPSLHSLLWSLQGTPPLKQETSYNPAPEPSESPQAVRSSVRPLQGVALRD